MTQTNKYRLRGYRRREGRDTPQEPFETTVIATGYDDAQHIVRENWRSEWQSIKITHVARLS